MEQQKKPTNAQLKKRLERAIIHVDRTKDTNEIFFSDKGLRLTISEDCAIVETSWHRHVFNNFTASGVCRPYIYTKRLVEIALENKESIVSDDGYSYIKLFDVLKNKEDKSDYNLAWYIDLWLFNIYQPLFTIGETEAESFLVYEAYMHNIATNSILLSEKTQGMTNKQFVQSVVDNMIEYTKGLDERVLFAKKTDEELMQEEIQAIQENDLEQKMEESANASQD